MAITVVQTAQNGTTAASGVSATVTLGSPTTAGNCLIVAAAPSGDNTNPSVSGMTLGGSAGNFGSLASVGGSGTDAILTWWADPACAGGQTSVVVSTTGGSGSALYLTVSVLEVSGLAGTLGGLLDQSSTSDQQAVSATFTSNTTPATAQASELWVGTVASFALVTYAGPSSPWTNLTEITSGGAHLNSMTGYQVTAATGTASYAGALNPHTTYEAGVITLLPAAVASGTGALMAAFP